MNSLIDIARLNRREKEAVVADVELGLVLAQSLAFWKKFNLTSKLPTDFQANTTATSLNVDESLVRQTLCSFIMVVAQHIDPQAKVTLTVNEEPGWLVFTVAGSGTKAQPFSHLDLHMQGYLGRATLLVLPSIEDNCPLVILEAMAAGLPVAASRIGGIPDLVEDGVNGLLFNPNDLQDSRSKVATLIEEPMAAGRMAGLAREQAWARYRPEAIEEVTHSRQLYHRARAEKSPT